MTRIITISGFLGAGKTTAIAALADYYTDNNMKVALITNDQGSDLVDTAFLSNQGFSTSEIFGGCFCCNFKDMIKTIMTIKEIENPDIIIAEAVGSCTDLYATVVKPLYHNHSDLFSIAPLVTMVDPFRALEVYQSKERIYPHEVAYLIKKQIEESSHLVITKEDLIDTDQLKEVVTLINDAGFNHTIESISSVTKKGIRQLASALQKSLYEEMPLMDLDYTVYTRAEKHLGWFNMSISIKGSKDIIFEDLARDFLGYLREKMIASDAEIAHLKLHASMEDDYSKVSLTSNRGLILFNQMMENNWTDYNLTINARIHIDPSLLKETILKGLDLLCHQYRFTYQSHHIESFMPGDPDANARTLNMAI